MEKQTVENIENLRFIVGLSTAKRMLWKKVKITFYYNV